MEENDRERLGRVAREAWIKWARQQPEPKASWLVPWDGLSEPEREVDRQIGEAVAAEAAARIAELEVEVKRLKYGDKTDNWDRKQSEERAAVLAEREACAKIADDMDTDHICDVPEKIAAAIRARPAP